MTERTSLQYTYIVIQEVSDQLAALHECRVAGDSWTAAEIMIIATQAARLDDLKKLHRSIGESIL